MLKSKQSPQSCCEEDEDKNITLVNKPFLDKLEKDEAQLIHLLSKNEFDKSLSSDTATASAKGINKIDPALLILLGKFNNCIVEGNLIDNQKGAIFYYRQMLSKWPSNSITENSHLNLTRELVDYGQSFINLYLSDADMDYIEESSKELSLLVNPLKDSKEFLHYLLVKQPSILIWQLNYWSITN